MDQDPRDQQQASFSPWRNRILNGVMVLAVILLGVTALRWAEEERTDRAYAQLSSQREPVSPQPAPKNPGTPMQDPSPVPAEEGNPPVENTGTEALYPHRTNPNARWMAINPDYSGWIRVSGTRIDYPYVRGDDNEEYLRKDFYGKPARAGTIFLDYRNLGGAGEAHTMLYGHNMKNGSMFHDLVKYHDADFLRENPLISLTDLYGRRTYRIFSVYEVSADDYTLPLDFENPENYRSFLMDLADLSMHEAEAIPEDAQLLSLITCSYGVDNGRTIIHALAMDP